MKPTTRTILVAGMVPSAVLIFSRPLAPIGPIVYNFDVP